MTPASQASPDLLRQVASLWTTQLDATPVSVRVAVAAAVEAHAADIAAGFYATMLDNPHARHFLSHELVEARLRREMQRWLRSLFPAEGAFDTEALVAQQVAVGAVHARIKLPVELMGIGTQALSERLLHALRGYLPDDAARAQATEYVLTIMSCASCLVLGAFVRETQRGARNDEAYRQHAFRHDALLERERQRAALSEWAQRCLMALPNPARRAHVTPLRRSEFAQWLEHKGRALFDAVPAFEQVVEAMEYIDVALLPRLLAGVQDEGAYATLLDEFDERIEFMRYSLNDMFERVPQADAGRDSITRLLNRRYLPTILARECEAFAAGGEGFCVALLRLVGKAGFALGVDGEEVHNHVLQRIAATLGEHAGAGDHLFRYTDQDFLLVEVDSTAARSSERISRLWRRLDETLRTLAPAGTHYALRVALTAADGHPDYQRLLRRLEFALASAGEQDSVLLV